MLRLERIVAYTRITLTHMHAQPLLPPLLALIVLHLLEWTAVEIIVTALIALYIMHLLARLRHEYHARIAELEQINDDVTRALARLRAHDLRRTSQDETQSRVA